MSQFCLRNADDIRFELSVFQGQQVERKTDKWSSGVGNGVVGIPTREPRAVNISCPYIL